MGGGAEKRRADATGERKTEAKRRRTRDLRLTGTESGTLLVVGNGDCGQFGLGDDDDDVRDSLKPVPMPSLAAMRVCSVVCGGLHAGVLTLDGRLFTWGCNDDEVLGRDGDESLPVLVEGALSGKRVSMITAGDSHMAALTSEGQVYAWGTYKDSNGYIDPDAKPEHGEARKIAKTPQLVPNLPKMRHIASGGDHVLALSDDGYEVYSWGCGEKGQLGKELDWNKKMSKGYLVPTKPWVVRLPEGNGTKDAKGRLQRALNENFLTWLRAEVGRDEAADCRDACESYVDHASELEAGEAGGLDDRVKLKGVYAGAYHSFALSMHGSVYSFGLNNMGQLGLGSLDVNFTGTPTLVSALEGKGISSLQGGEHHSIALSTDGEVYTFGRGDNNQLGFGDGTDQQLTPRLVPALKGIAVRTISTQANSNFAISRSGDLYAWGFGEMGQLCNGKVGDESTPTLVEASGVAGQAVLDVASGAQHSVILTMERPD